MLDIHSTRDRGESYSQALVRKDKEPANERDKSLNSQRRKKEPEADTVKVPGCRNRDRARDKTRS